MTYLIVHNWEKFQHYKDRNPVWIKVHLELTHKDEWRKLTLAERGLLLGIWQEYASSHRLLTDDTASLTRRLGARVLRTQLISLSHAGFITLGASKPLAERYQRASPDKEEEEEQTQDRTGPPLTTPGAGAKPSPSPSTTEDKEAEKQTKDLTTLTPTLYATLEGLKEKER